jgi:hypothetical protein
MKPDLCMCAAKTGTNLWFRSTRCEYFGKPKRDLLNSVFARSCKSYAIFARKTFNLRQGMAVALLDEPAVKVRLI